MDKSTIIFRELAREKVQAMSRTDLERAYLELLEAADALAYSVESDSIYRMELAAAYRKATQ